MSHRSYGGGRRKNYRDDYDDTRYRETYESPEDRLKSSIIRFGGADADAEVPVLVRQIKDTDALSIPAVAEGFRIGVTEQPYKIPHYALLLRSLDQNSERTSDTPLGKQILDDVWKGFQGYLDKLAWKDVRLCVQFFAHLTSARVISAQTMLALLQSFAAVLEEFGVSHNRAKNAALCAAEGLLLAGQSLKSHSSSEVSNIISVIETYIEMSASSNFLVCPLVRLHTPSIVVEGADELLDLVLSVLKAQDSSNFFESSTSVLRPYETDDDQSFMPYFDLPFVLVPPEVLELESFDDGEEPAVNVQKNDDWPEYRLSLFDNEITADTHTLLGYAVNSLISDIIDIFEVNRKECARLLLEVPRWVPPGTFKPRPGTPDQPADGPSWQLESCIMENILSKLCILPRPPHKSVYYVALISELCKASPSTTGPAVGKSIRKLYGLLGDGFDVELSQRFVGWFAVHMSNFGFQWVWKEWIPDLQLVSQHPKRSFMRRAIELEIRLAYFDRIVKTLPESYLAPDVDVAPDQGPGPEFDYDDPLKPHHDVAQSVLNLLKGRSKAEEVISHIETLKNTLAESAEADVNVDAVIRSMTIQSLLNIGSRSFSHFLNAIERYLPVLRHLADSSDAKLDLLTAAAEFWRRNRQMVNIVFDKLMQYQIVDPSDVISWAFSGPMSAGSHVIDAFRWSLIEGALDKANGRVAIAKRRVSLLRKEEDDSRARTKASGTMEVDADIPPETREDVPVVDSPALTNALKAYATLTKEQKTVLSKTLNEFVDALKDSSSLLSEKAWQNRANWENSDWEVWQTWAWYRNFCRLYALYLRTYATTLGTVALAKISTSSDDASSLIKKIWNVSTGQES